MFKIMVRTFPTSQKNNTVFQLIENKWIDLIRNNVFYAVSIMDPLINGIYVIPG